MSWLLGKIFPFGSSSSSSSSASAPASTSDVNAPASVPRESTAELDAAKAPASGAVSAAPVHTTRSDLLTVSVINGQGLTLPSGTTLASPSTDQAGPSKMAQRQRHASLPYVVLEFDKNEVLIMASGVFSQL
ncbi:agc akt protein kinase [Malassezia pachydermatis]|uniref:Agc akt protein kinase n=1 Tax=Malassezia pachydermatis TaxID=77020 RepID=A0A0M8MT78_9BASI|nr:agc akt protein kinase [Malassezia pachydermatis]KOS13141.1 agc akt protein kinase [Malassezia pachydermatis]